MPPQTFGNRFLAEFRRLGGSTRDWPAQALVLLDRADRRQFIDALTKASSTVASQLAIAAHTADPERIAKRAIELTKSDGADVLTPIVLAVLATTGR
jgi:hypothetical protein